MGIAQALSSAPLDRAMFRDGEIKRSTQAFFDWVLVCDEMVRLKRRFCSLRTEAMNEDGQVRLVLDVSTGDDGRPAALLHLPTNLGLSSGVRVRDPRSEHGSQSHPVVACSVRECQSVWTMTAPEIDALAAGRGLTVAYQTGTMADMPIFSVRLHELATEHARISGRGFHEAITASLN